jgi:predicted NodU family carbamoyl transferase
VNAPGQLADGAPHPLQARFRGVRPDGPFRWHFVPHHLAHAASAFHASPFARAAVLTLDGRGERATTGYAVGNGNELEWLGQVHVPHSLGLLYEAVTGYLGFLHSCDEYKVMALASFGKPRYLAEFRDVVRLGPEGRYTIGPLRLEERFGPPRLRGGPLEQRHYDVAHSLQVVLEELEAFLRWTQVPYRWLSDVPEQTADLLARDQIIGWFQGRMEFGPRALGARSILASPLHADMQARLNEIKDREDFRPVAPPAGPAGSPRRRRGASRPPRAATRRRS